MCICVVCMHLCIHVTAHVCVHVSKCVFMWMHVCVCMCLNMYSCECICAHMCVHVSEYVFMWMHVDAHVCAHVSECVFIWMHMYQEAQCIPQKPSFWRQSLSLAWSFCSGLHWLPLSIWDQHTCRHARMHSCMHTLLPCSRHPDFSCVCTSTPGSVTWAVQTEFRSSHCEISTNLLRYLPNCEFTSLHLGTKYRRTVWIFFPIVFREPSVNTDTHWLLSEHRYCY